MERSREKIVDFSLCKFCTNWKTNEIDEPCAECLDYASNWDSRRPIHFEDNGELIKLLKKES